MALVAPRPTAALPERAALKLQLQVVRKRKAFSASSEIREEERSIQTGHGDRRCMRESKRAASVSDTGSKEEEGKELAGFAEL